MLVHKTFTLLTRKKGRTIFRLPHSIWLHNNQQQFFLISNFTPKASEVSNCDVHESIKQFFPVLSYTQNLHQDFFENLCLSFFADKFNFHKVFSFNLHFFSGYLKVDSSFYCVSRALVFDFQSSSLIRITQNLI